MRAFMLKLFRVIAYLVLFAAIILFVRWQVFIHSPLFSSQQNFEYFYQPGTTPSQMVKELAARKVLSQPKLFLLLIMWRGEGKRLQAGEYEFTPSMMPDDVIHELLAGQTFARKFTIVEGWTMQDVLTAIKANRYLSHSVNADDLSTLRTALQIDGSLEGLVLPETYHFERGTSDVELLQRAHSALLATLEIAWGGRTTAQYQTPYQALIAASLIEKETALDAERPMIAGVITRRLQKNMPLQIDAAIIYGIRDQYNGVINKRHLKLNTPYNTYLHRGLPPTPIALPSALSIKAALQPKTGKALYFVAKGDGSHVFSSNLAEHNRAVKRYILDAAEQSSALSRQHYLGACIFKANAEYSVGCPVAAVVG